MRRQAGPADGLIRRAAGHYQGGCDSVSERAENELTRRASMLRASPAAYARPGAARPRIRPGHDAMAPLSPAAEPLSPAGLAPAVQSPRPVCPRAL